MSFGYDLGRTQNIGKNAIGVLFGTYSKHNQIMVNKSKSLARRAMKYKKSVKHHKIINKLYMYKNRGGQRPPPTGGDPCGYYFVCVYQRFNIYLVCLVFFLYLMALLARDSDLLTFVLYLFEHVPHDTQIVFFDHIPSMPQIIPKYNSFDHFKLIGL